MRYILCIFFSGLYLTGYTQGPELNFKYITRENGLSNSSVLSILQDSKGYLWFGTEDGLNRYDGYGMTVYKNNPNIPNTISSNCINQILEDKQHRIWIATNYGLNVYDRSKDTFIRYMHDPNRRGSISNNVVLSMAIDSDGKLWFGTASGLNLFDEQNHRFQSFFINWKTKEPYSANVIHSLFFDNKKRFWVGSESEGLLLVDRQNGKFSIAGDFLPQLASLKSTNVTAIRSDLSGNLWIGTNANGLYRYSETDHKIQNFRQDPLQVSGLSANGIQSILCDHKNNLWIGTENGGLNLWLPKSNTFAHYENDPQKPNSLSQKTAACIYEDNQENLWVGVRRGGVNLFAPHANRFKKYGQGYLPGELSFKDVRTFCEDDNGDIWIGTDGGGINVWNPNSKIFRKFRYNSHDQRSLGSDAVLNILKDHSGTIWIGTWQGGLNRYNRETGTFTRFVHSISDKNSISSNYVLMIFEDRERKLWVGTSYGGLNLFDPGTQKFSRITQSPDGKTHFAGTKIFSINEDKLGNLWIGTQDKGLNFLSADRQRFEHYFFNSNNDLTDGVRVVFMDHKDRIWVGKTGLYLFDPKKKAFALYSNDPALVVDKIQAINEDGEGNLWISTNNGLIQFNPESRQLKKFTEADGLQNLEFSQNSSLKTRSGKMLFGGYNGFNEFDPKTVNNYDYNYPVYISKLLFFKKSAQQGNIESAVERDISESKRVNLDYSQSVFSIEYAALNYVAPLKTRYAYKLTGFEKDWNYVGTSRKATYTNLDPGNYTFYVKASNPDGSWNNNAATIEVTVLPPFWMTFWFRSLIVIALMFTVFIILYYRRKAELRLFHEKKQKEMHQLQLQFFTNISHEFRTPLTLILGTLEQVLKKDAGSVLTGYYHTINRNANRLMHLIGELMDFRKTETGSLKLKVMPANFGLFINEIVQEFYDHALTHHITFTIQLEKVFEQAWFDRQVMEKVLLNLMNNAFKYTPDGGEISIRVSSERINNGALYEGAIKFEHEYRAKEYIFVSITDTGIGISSDAIKHLFERFYRVSDHHMGSGIGLAFVKSLINLHKGSVYVHSQSEKGTEIIIAVPCSEQDYSDEEKQIDQSSQTNIQLESVQHKDFFNKTLDELDPNKPTPQPEIKKHSILIVDDNVELRAYFKEILEPFYKISEADNGAVGLQKAKDESPELIISDVMMPVMDGIDFCAHIKEDFETSHIPFILLTAKDALESRIEGMESGADHYFSKPVSTDLLMLTIRNLFIQRQKIKERYLKDYQVEVRDLVHSAKDKDFLNQLLKLIENKLEDPELNVDYVCREIGVSKTKLYKKIKDITGQSINEFIRTIRLKKSIEIMTHEDVLITEVMYRVGILSQSYYTTIFKKEFGMTPSQFQQQLDSKKVAETKKNIR